MREIFRFRPESMYGRGMAGELVKQLLQHQTFTFKILIDENDNNMPKIIEIWVEHQDSVDDDGDNTHDFA